MFHFYTEIFFYQIKFEILENQKLRTQNIYNVFEMIPEPRQISPS